MGFEGEKSMQEKKDRVNPDESNLLAADRVLNILGFRTGFLKFYPTV